MASKKSVVNNLSASTKTVSKVTIKPTNLHKNVSKVTKAPMAKIRDAKFPRPFNISID